MWEQWVFQFPIIPFLRTYEKKMSRRDRSLGSGNYFERDDFWPDLRIKFEVTQNAKSDTATAIAKMTPTRQFVDRESANSSKNPVLIEIDISRRNETRKQIEPTPRPVYTAVERI
jgi:hypothetical protein